MIDSKFQYDLRRCQNQFSGECNSAVQVNSCHAESMHSHGYRKIFKNGWQVDVQWGKGNYSGCDTVEVQVWDKDELPVTEEEVAAHVSIEQATAIEYWAMQGNAERIQQIVKTDKALPLPISSIFYGDAEVKRAVDQATAEPDEKTGAQWHTEKRLEAIEEYHIPNLYRRLNKVERRVGSEEAGGEEQPTIAQLVHRIVELERRK